MPNRLHRYYGAGYLHFITTSCYQRRMLFGSRLNRDLFLQVLEQVRRRLRTDLGQGHLWSEALEAGHVWQRRFYDFVVFSEKKRVEKLDYMHRNPGSPASPVLACGGGSR